MKYLPLILTLTLTLDNFELLCTKVTKLYQLLDYKDGHYLRTTDSNDWRTHHAVHINGISLSKFFIRLDHAAPYKHGGRVAQAFCLFSQASTVIADDWGSVCGW